MSTLEFRKYCSSIQKNRNSKVCLQIKCQANISVNKSNQNDLPYRKSQWIPYVGQILDQII